MHRDKLLKQAREILAANDRGGWTQPGPGLYPHQWLWDSCFIAIGLSHINVERAKAEIRSLLKNQWYNGMIPHIIFSDAKGYHAGPALWQTHRSPNCPPNVDSTGITQPPMIAEAVVRIGEKLPAAERLEWYKEVFPGVSRYHNWLRTARDPKQTGLATLTHPWESGMDNSPPWMETLRLYLNSNRLRLMEALRFTEFAEMFRKDTKVAPAAERMSTYDLYGVYTIIKRQRQLRYDDQEILETQRILLQDLSYNSILIRADELLAQIAKEINQPLSSAVAVAHKRGVRALEELWDPKAKQYYSKNYVLGKLVKSPTLGTFLPLYSGKLPAQRVRALMKHFHDPKSYGTRYPIPSTPVNSSYFNPRRYWQGPVWVPVNWLLIDGLKRNGLAEEAEALRQKTIELVAEQGMHEYYSPLDGTPAGDSQFSWTAALVIDLLNS